MVKLPCQTPPRVSRRILSVQNRCPRPPHQPNPQPRTDMKKNPASTKQDKDSQPIRFDPVKSLTRMKEKMTAEIDKLLQYHEAKPPEGYVTAKVAREMLGKRAGTLKQLTDNGVIGSLPHGDWQRFYKRDDIIRLLVSDEFAKHSLLWRLGKDGAVYTELGQLVMSADDVKKAQKRKLEGYKDAVKARRNGEMPKTPFDEFRERRRQAKILFAARGVKKGRVSFAEPPPESMGGILCESEWLHEEFSCYPHRRIAWGWDDLVKKNQILASEKDDTEK